METRRLADPRTDFAVRLVDEVPRLRRLLVQRVGSGAQLDDAVQETLLLALQGAHGFDAERAVWPWLRTIAERSGRGAVARGAELTLVDEPAAPETSMACDGDSLESLLSRLPDPEREVIERFYVRGESVGEISTALGLPQGTVKSRMWRARRRIAVLAAVLAPMIWLLVRTESKLPQPVLLPLTLEAMVLETPRLESIEHAADGPLTWSLEGGAWADDALNEGE